MAVISKSGTRYDIEMTDRWQSAQPVAIQGRSLSGELTSNINKHTNKSRYCVTMYTTLGIVDHVDLCHLFDHYCCGPTVCFVVPRHANPHNLCAAVSYYHSLAFGDSVFHLHSPDLAYASRYHGLYPGLSHACGRGHEYYHTPLK
ncbi:hypothetical protein AG1IA_00326 [Rhizoctonia solani AG-1 IA]|uniref:Uncharacterized protein n=1 Tax=Thanatephorus cucumeris (strain AG1-IA) TaxID=983506 RepID=L8XAE9_THACA|nr:hypothetical protein AG1IA_00326 [Rhizoctonia solani AG-1 IA]